jgi:geranylgeranyl diphosphate synthase type II
VGALIGSGGAADVRPMVRFGFLLGAAFQIRDDVLNLVGDADLYGKEINGDLHEGKRTLMLIHLASEARGQDRAMVAAYLATTQSLRTAEQVAEIRHLMNVYSSIDFAAEYGEGLAHAARAAFDDAFAQAKPGADKDFLRALIPYMVGRRS